MAAHPDDLADERGPRVDASLVMSGLAAVAGLGWLVRALMVSPALPPPVAVTYAPSAILSPSVVEAAVGSTTPSDTGWRLQQAQGVDSRGRAVIFQLISGEVLGWERGGVVVRELQGNQRRDLVTELNKAPLAGALLAAHAVVVVGAAAFDEPTELAGRRAEKLAALLGGMRAVWRLDLGRDLRPCLGCDAAVRSGQRPLALIAVSAAHEGADLAAALRDALSRQGESWPTPGRYEQFNLVR